MLVIEAGSRSGALITCDFALEQGRDVFALPGNVNSPYSLGTNQLIKEGAKMVTCVEDILEEFGMDEYQTGGKSPQPAYQLDILRLRCIMLLKMEKNIWKNWLP